VEVIDVWNGHYACKLQSALRMTNEVFANHLGIALRTVATWHSDPAVIPRAEMQQLLDDVYEKAPRPVRQRFVLLARDANASSAGTDSGGPQALRVAIAVVVGGDQVLLVHRRNDGASGLTWQFPAGVIKPGGRPETTAVHETLNETGVHCAVRQSLGSRTHPITGVRCEYFFCEFLAGEARNRDVIENMDVTWAPRNEVTRFIAEDTIFPPVLAALEVPS
jgi:8-oxo-dGTP diphosphatase